MSRCAALLRAVNVGGTGILAMAELKTMCEATGFTEVRTYIASGNVVFADKLDEAAMKRRLERQLHDYADKPVGVLMHRRQDVLGWPTIPTSSNRPAAWWRSFSTVH